MCLGDLYGCPVAAGTIALDLVMLFVAAAAGRNAVGNGHGHRRHVASGAGKLVPVMIEADGPHLGARPAGDIDTSISCGDAISAASWQDAQSLFEGAW